MWMLSLPLLRSQTSVQFRAVIVAVGFVSLSTLTFVLDHSAERGCSVSCGHLAASLASTLPPSCDNQVICRHCQCALGDTITPGWEFQSRISCVPESHRIMSCLYPIVKEQNENSAMPIALFVSLPCARDLRPRRTLSLSLLLPQRCWLLPLRGLGCAYIWTTAYSQVVG